MDGAMEMDRPMESEVARPTFIIGFHLKHQELEDDNPNPVVRKTIRFRGVSLRTIGMVYPDADVLVHRLGEPVESDFEAKGGVLYSMRSAFDSQAIYRVTLTKCDAPNESSIYWSQSHLDGLGYTADGYCNLLELGGADLGQMMMFTICRNDLHFW